LKGGISNKILLLA